MNNLPAIAEALHEELARENAAREAALPLGREIVKLASQTIRAAHRGEFGTARTLLAQAGAKVSETRERFAVPHPDIYGAGYVQDSHKEYAEASLVVAILEGAALWPNPAELGVAAAAYLNGLGEAVGECRRYALDLMRRDQLAEADAILGVMDAIYESLVTFDYPDAVTSGLRRTTDLARGILERTRADVALTMTQARVRDELRRVWQDNKTFLSEEGTNSIVVSSDEV